MPAEFLSVLKAEIAELQAALSVDPRFQKLESLRASLAHYEGQGQSESSQDVSTATAQKPKGAGRKSSEAREKAVQLSENYLKSLPGNLPTPTRDIYEAVIEGVVEISGKDPVSNLSAMLSGHHAFNSNGRKGWTLSERDSALPPPSLGQLPVATNTPARPAPQPQAFVPPITVR